jgi:hypothetical protein
MLAPIILFPFIVVTFPENEPFNSSFFSIAKANDSAMLNNADKKNITFFILL